MGKVEVLLIIHNPHTCYLHFGSVVRTNERTNGEHPKRINYSSCFNERRENRSERGRQIEFSNLMMKAERKSLFDSLSHHHDLFNGLRHSSLYLMGLCLCWACLLSSLPSLYRRQGITNTLARDEPTYLIPRRLLWRQRQMTIMCDMILQRFAIKVFSRETFPLLQ